MIALLALTVLPSQGGAQNRPPSDSLPRELVVALLGGSLGGRQVDIRPGLADDSLPADLFRDAMLLGFADYRVTVTTVAYFPYSPQATIDTIKARLVRVGWSSPPEDSTTERGFVTAYGGSRPLAICRGRSVVVPTVVVRNLGRTLAVISRQGTESASFFCGGDRGRNERLRMGGVADTPLPALSPPAGMMSEGGGGTGVASRDRGMTLNTSLTGSTPLSEMLAHYSGLFEKAGWKKMEERVATTIAVAAFEITTNGETWHCAIAVSIPAQAAADVFLTLRKR